MTTINTARAAMNKARKLVAGFDIWMPTYADIQTALLACYKARDAADDMAYQVGGIWDAKAIEARALAATCEAAEAAHIARKGAGTNHPKRYTFDGGEAVAFRRSLGLSA